MMIRFEALRADLKADKIRIDENGVARNYIGRALMRDMLEKLTDSSLG